MNTSCSFYNDLCLERSEFRRRVAAADPEYEHIHKGLKRGVQATEMVLVGTLSSASIEKAIPYKTATLQGTVSIRVNDTDMYITGIKLVCACACAGACACAYACACACASACVWCWGV